MFVQRRMICKHRRGANKFTAPISESTFDWLNELRDHAGSLQVTVPYSCRLLCSTAPRVPIIFQLRPYESCHCSITLDTVTCSIVFRSALSSFSGSLPVHHSYRYHFEHHPHLDRRLAEHIWQVFRSLSSPSSRATL